MARAFGLAGSQSAGTFAAWGTPTVKFHQCRGALSGLMAALLAEQEFVATREFLTEPDGGLYNTYAEGGKPEAALAGLGTVWELEKLALRPWPSASSIQGMITAMIDLVEQHEIDPAQVEQVRITLSPPVFKLHGGFATYAAKFEAMLSAHYVVTAILHDRALTLEQFEPARYDAAALRSFAADRVVVTEDSSLSGHESRAEIETADGAVLESYCEFPRGAPENPLTRAQIIDKFRTYAAPRLSEAGIETVIDAVTRLEDLASAAELFDMLRAAPQPARRSA
jgi:2-methylcitrate dehydratase PrpD